ncbi:hypothetical protein [Beijerinckia sp. L45]|uniref:hypothetical protein n=1 Tax=Beijerinckia sp. L45 TaxID=1641855 RepID=UPI00131C6520|nr:hypothetical protein [Beijerinckia sp. L45]
MADRVITAEALITAKDGTGDVFTKIASKFQQLGKGAKVSADIDKMSQTLERAQSQLRALDKLQGARSKFADARSQFNAQKVAVEQAAKAMQSAEKPTRELEAAYKRTQAAVSRASAEFERQKTALLDAKRAAEGFGSPLSKMAAEQTRLRGVVDATTRSIEHQAAAELKAADAATHAAAAHRKMEREEERRAHDIAHHGVANFALGAAAGAVSAHGIASVGERTIEAGAELQHERVASLNAGRTPEELRAYEDAARDVSIKRPTASYIESMKTLLETTSSFGSVEHAIEHLDFMMRTASVLKASSGGKIDESSGEMGQQFAKFFEMRGVANDPKRFEAEGNEMVRAMAATGGTFNPREMFNFAQQAKSSLRNYDLQYLSRVVPSLIGEQGGDRAGTAANAFSSVIMGKARDKKQTAEWMKYGLLDPSKVSDKKDSWSSGAVKNTDIALRNPLKWFEDTVLPAMRAKGVNVDDTLELSKVLGGMFRNQNSNVFANENAQLADRTRLHKDAGLYDLTAHPEDMYQRNLREDPTQSMTALTASLSSLSSAVSQPAMQTAAGVITSISGALVQLAAAAKDHPIAAMTAGAATGAGALAGAGYMSYQLMNGFGLGASATALDHSAAALDAAAVRLGAAGAAGAAEGGLAGVARSGAKAAGLFGMGSLGSAGIGMGGLLAFDAAMIYGAPKLFGTKKGARYGGKEGEPDEDPDHPGMHFVRAARRGSSGYWENNPVAPTFSGGVHGYLGEAPHPALAPISERAGSIPTFAGLGAGSTGSIEATVKPDQITAKMEGQATVSVTVKVDGPGQVTNQVSSATGNIKVSTGASMPGAKAATTGAGAK